MGTFLGTVIWRLIIAGMSRRVDNNIPYPGILSTHTMVCVVGLALLAADSPNVTPASA